MKNVKLDQHRLEMAIVENVQRADLNAIEAAKAYNRLQDEFNLTQREIASRVGKSRASIANTMRLLSLPSEVQEAVGSGRVSESQARLLMTIDDAASQSRIFKEILFKNLSVRELKNEIEKYRRDARVPQKQSMFSRDPVALNLQRALEEFLGADVRLDSSGESGKITIRFQSKEELQAIVEKMTSHESVDTHQTVSNMYERTQQTDVSGMMGLDTSLSEPSSFANPPSHEATEGQGAMADKEPVREEPVQVENSFDMSDVVAPPAVQSEIEDTFHTTEQAHEDSLPMEQPEHDILASYGFGGEDTQSNSF
ncbi:MAG: ParB/RepB/Spo0J family partition protein [Candidatus Paceibacterota bacterium]